MSSATAKHPATRSHTTAPLLAFEWRYHTRRLVFAGAVIVLSAMAAFFVSSGYGPRNTPINAPYVVMQSLGVLSMFSVFLVTMLCANAALRDDDAGMTELVMSKPLSKASYLGTRWLGVCAAALTAFAVATLVLAVAPFLVQVDAARLGAFGVAPYAAAFVMLVIPNVLLVTTALFAMAVLTRSTLMTYIAAVALYAAYMVFAFAVNSPLLAGVAPTDADTLARAALLDPFGLSAFFEQTRYWTATERQTRLVSMSGHLLMNRLACLGVTAGLMGGLYRRFRFGVRTAGKARAPRTARRWWRVSGRSSPVPAPAQPYQPTAPVARGHAPGLQWWSTARTEWRQLAAGWPLRATLVVWVFVVALQAVGEIDGGEYGTSLLATTSVLFNAIYAPLMLVGTIVLLYYTTEVAWRERAVHVHPLIDATPANSAAAFGAKLVVLCGIPVVMVLAAIVVGIVMQLTRGYTSVDVGVYAALLWYGAAPLALLAVAFLAIHSLSPNRWVGLLGGLCFAILASRGAAIGLEHPMFRFASGLPIEHSPMDGFGPVASSFAVFMGYWALIALALALLGWGCWPRGADIRVVSRVRAARTQWGPRGRIAFIGSTCLAVLSASLLTWHLNATHAWQSSERGRAWQAGYEQRYRRVAARPQPDLVAVEAAVDLYPDDRRADIHATYTLENRTGLAIDTVWLVEPGTASAFAVAATAGRVIADSEYGVHVIALERSLLPMARTALSFTLRSTRGGIRGTNFAYDVTGNGTLLTSDGSFPTLGYRRGFELRDPARRTEYGLSAHLSETPSREGSDADRASTLRNAAWLKLDLTLSTSADQSALAPGELTGSWMRGARRYFHYVTPTEITPTFAIVSARYTVDRSVQDGVALEIWHDPRHSDNVSHIRNAAGRALAELGARYGSYPRRTLRIAEVPGWANFGAYALSGLVLFPESRGFLTQQSPDGVDLIARRVAHEVSHQWWAHTLDPADVTGGTALVETLAKHSEQLVVAAMQGDSALPDLLAYDEDRYFAGRAEEREAEPTLMDVTSQSYVYYGKGAIVMNGLRDLLGADAVDHALADLVRHYGGPQAAARTNDWRAAMLGVAADSVDRALVREWLEARTVYDLRVDTVETRPAGVSYALRGRISVQKFNTGARGEEAVSADGEHIDVWAYDGAPPFGRVLSRGRYAVTRGAVIIDTVLTAHATHVVVDPMFRRLDRARGNNVARVIDAH